MRRREFVVSLSIAGIACSLVALAQQKTTPVIGILGSGSAGAFTSPMGALRQGLGDVGYAEGRNLAIEYRWAEGSYERLPSLAADLVNRRVDVIAALATPAARVAKQATSVIPIVFAVGADPVADGLVASFARPGGNVTGVAILQVELTAKRLDLLSELVPGARVIALLVNPKNPGIAQPVIQHAQTAARAKGVQLPILSAATEEEIDAAFRTLVDLDVGAIFVAPDPFFFSRSPQVVALASQHAIPAMYFGREDVAAGGLIGYGASRAAFYRRAGTYIAKVLDGAKPADLPVEQPTKFELVINLKTARALRLTVPQALLQRADEIIE